MMSWARYLLFQSEERALFDKKLSPVNHMGDLGGFGNPCRKK
jgi:hypothetical protein